MTRLIFILIISLASTICSQAQTIQYIGAPTTTVISRGNFRTDSIFYLPKRTKLPTDTAAIRYQISDSSVYVWTGSAWRKAGGIDTTSLSNRINLKLNISDTAAMLSPYYRSATAGAALALKLNISDTSTMLTPYLRKADTTAMLSPYYRTATATAALALKLNISDTSSMLGNYIRHAGYGLTKSGQAFLVDTAAMATRARVQKGIDSIGGLLSGGTIGGSGTTNYVPKFTASTTLGNSLIFDNGSRVGVNTATPDASTILHTARGSNGTVATFGIQGLTINPRIRIDASETNNTVSFNTNYNGATSPAITFLTTETERLRITSGGDVGIGTNSPNTKTEIFGGDARVALSAVTTSTFRGYQMATGTTEFASLKAEASAGELRLTSGFAGFGGFTTMYTNGSERLRIFANGRIGVNTTTDAGYQFDVNGSMRTTNGAQFGTTSGNVGIGTTSPQVKLVVSNGGNLGLEIDPTNTSGTVLNMFAYDRVAAVYRTLALNSGGGDVAIGSTSASYKLDINGTLRSVNGANFATTSGNVGIGTASPQRRLSVNVPFSTTGEITHLLSGQTGTTPLIEITSIVENVSTAATAMGFNTFTANAASSSEKMRLTNNGELLIATTTDAGDYKLQVAGNIYNTGSAVLAATSGNVGIGVTPYPHSNILRALDLNTAGGIAASTAGISIQSNAYYNGSNFIYRTTGNPANYFELNEGGVGNFAWFRAASGTAGNTVTFTQAMTLNSASELLVNTTSDAGDYKLQVAGNIYNTGSAVLAATSGGVAIGTTTTSGKLNILGDNDQINLNTTGTWSAIYFKNAGADRAAIYVNNTSTYIEGRGSSGLFLGGAGATAHVNLNSNGEFIIGTGASDAGDYKLQVVGNARIGTGKLDIASNTTFGLGVARSGTSEVAGQIYNSNGILYLGAESSAGGQIFSGSSAYAAVIGSGANYPLQFATNNITRATINTNGELLINTTSDQGDYKLQVNGSVYNTGQVTRGQLTVIGTSAQLFVDSTTNLSTFYGTQFLTGSNISPFLGGVVGWNTTGNVNGIDLYINNTASGSNSNFMQLGDATNVFKVTKDAGIITGNPSSGTAQKWKLGSVVSTTVGLNTSQYVEVEINGTLYRLAIVNPL